jgi:hypothetical protein
VNYEVGEMLPDGKSQVISITCKTCNGTGSALQRDSSAGDNRNGDRYNLHGGAARREHHGEDERSGDRRENGNLDPNMPADKEENFESAHITGSSTYTITSPDGTSRSGHTVEVDSPNTGTGTIVVINRLSGEYPRNALDVSWENREGWSSERVEQGKSFKLNRFPFMTHTIRLSTFLPSRSHEEVVRLSPRHPSAVIEATDAVLGAQ